MVGEPVQLVEEGMARIIRELKADPYAIETAWISVIVFAGQAKTLVPLQELIHFYPPRFPVGGGTALSKGLGQLMFELRKNQVKTTYEQKGDWKPLIFMFTDGVPTDETTAAIQEWQQQWRSSVNLVAIAMGAEADTPVLREITDHVLLFNNSNADTYKQFFRWITASIKTTSESVENSGSGFELAKTDGDTLSKIDLTKAPPPAQYADSNFVVLAGKCQHTQRPYLMKYRKVVQPAAFSGLDLQTRAYRLVGAFAVTEAYHELSDNIQQQFSINTSELIGVPTCPCCGNQTAFAVCGCGQVHCIGDEEVSRCPQCGNQGRYTSSGEEGFDVNRTQG